MTNNKKIDQEDLKYQIDVICIERGLEPKEVYNAIATAIASAYRREFGDREKNYEAEFNQNTGKYSIYEVTNVVEEVINPEREVDLIQAKLYNPNSQLGDKIKKEIIVDNDINFGRIASQVARQVLFQTINSIRHTKILQKFKERIGDVVNVEVDYFKKGGYVVKLGQTNGYISRDNLSHLDRFKSGQSIKALIVDITEDDRGISRIFLSRTSPDFVKSIIKNEVPEIESGLVSIDKIVREPGFRTKILVSTADEEVIDPVGTILGKKNIRLINIMREISTTMQEKIDVIENNPEDLEIMIMDALEPAEIEKIEIKEDKSEAIVYCYESEVPLAVGRAGTNIKLASELLDIHLNIESIAGQKESFHGPSIITE